MLPTLAQDPGNQAFVEMFLQEARIAARLSHPNIVHILDFGQIDGDYFLAMEYVDGVTLESVLEKTRTTGQPALPWPIAVRIVAAPPRDWITRTKLRMAVGRRSL